MANISQSGFSPVADHSGSTVEDVLKWKSTAEVKYNKEQGYWSDKEKPVGSLGGTTMHVLRRSSNDRADHRAAIDQIAQDFHAENPEMAQEFKQRFALRRVLGQPVTVDALEQFTRSTLRAKGALSGTAEDFRRGISNIRSTPRPSRDHSQEGHDFPESSVPYNSTSFANQTDPTTSDYKILVDGRKADDRRALTASDFPEIADQKK